jgi:hypothetical protein
MTPPPFLVLCTTSALILCLSRAALLLRRRAAATAALASTAQVPVLPWRPRWAPGRPYTSSSRNLLDSIRAKCVTAAAGGAHAAFGVVLYDTPCLHVGDAFLARSLLLAAGSSKSPWYDAFKGFVGEGLFTADGDDWSVHSAS